MARTKRAAHVRTMALRKASGTATAGTARRPRATQQALRWEYGIPVKEVQTHTLRIVVATRPSANHNPLNAIL